METTNKTKDIKLVTIIAKLWFDKINGNTYHNSFLTIEYNNGDVESLESGFTYGYGNQWNQSALDVFKRRFGITTNESYHNKISYKIRRKRTQQRDSWL